MGLFEAGEKGRPLRLSRLLGLALMAFTLFVQVELGESEDVPWRHDWWDRVHQWSPRDRGDPAEGPVVVVAIDEDSMAETQRWPWPRDIIADLLKALHENGAAAVAFDIILDDQDPQSPIAQADRFAKKGSTDGRMVSRLLGRVIGDLGDTDEQLARAINVAVNPIDGARPTATIMPLTGVPRFEGVNPENECRFNTPFLVTDPPDLGLGEGFYSADVPLELFREAGALLAAIDFSASNDFIVRKVRAIQNICGAPFLLLGVEALRAARQDFFISATETPTGLQFEFLDPDKDTPLTFPAERDGTFWLHYGPIGVENEAGGTRKLRRYISARDVLNGTVEPGRLRDKVVILAVVDLGRIDERRSPLGEIIYGVEAHMQMVEQIVTQDFLRRPWFMFIVETVILGVLSLLVILVVPRAPPGWSLVIIPAGIAGLLWLVLVLFRQGLLIDLASPALGLAIVSVGVVGVTLVERDRARLKNEIDLQSERADRAFFQGEIDAAARIQSALLPPRRYSEPGRVDLACYIDPARTVGGDFYDHFMVDETHLFFLVADVSGKGADASQFMLLSKTLWKSVALRTGRPLERIQIEANAEITRENTATMFVTGLCGLLDLQTGQLSYSSAGHDSPYLFGDGRNVAQLPPFSGPPAGLIDGMEFPVGSVGLAPGDRLCIFTDGVTEAMDRDGVLYGAERLEAALAAAPSALDSTGLVAHIVADVRAFTGAAEQSDDLTLMVVSIPETP